MNSLILSTVAMKHELESFGSGNGGQVVSSGRKGPTRDEENPYLWCCRIPVKVNVLLCTNPTVASAIKDSRQTIFSTKSKWSATTS